MMMIASNSLVRLNDGAQGEDKEEVGDRRKEGQTGTLTLPLGQLNQGYWMRGTEENMDGGVGH